LFQILGKIKIAFSRRLKSRRDESDFQSFTKSFLLINKVIKLFTYLELSAQAK